MDHLPHTSFHGSHEGESLAEQYDALAKHRNPWMDRAQRAALLTQPSLFPEDHFGPHSELNDAYQSEGSRGVENLSAKMTTALFPPGVRWFNYRLTPEGEQAIAQSNSVDSTSQGQIDSILSKRERIVWNVLEQPWLRPMMAEVFRHLIVGGNGGIQQIAGETTFRFWPMNTYVVSRDNADHVLKAILKERVAAVMLTDEQQELLEGPEDDSPMLYTVYQRKNRTTFESWQEINKKRVPGSDATYPEDLLPFRPLRWERISGQSYGRSYVDKVIGDLASLEGLSEALLTIAAEASRLLYLVDPAGVTNIDDLETARNGSYRYGRKIDVSTLQAEKLQDLQTASALTAQLRDSLREAFFVGGTIQRSGERVTATEIQFLASELDTALGGAFSLNAMEIQQPMLSLTVNRLLKQNKLDPLPEALIDAKLITGLESLGKNNELLAFQKFDALVASIPPEEFSLTVNHQERVMRAAEIAGINSEGYILSLEDYKARQQARQQQQVAQAGVPLATAAINQQ